MPCLCASCDEGVSGRRGGQALLERRAVHARLGDDRRDRWPPASRRRPDSTTGGACGGQLAPAEAARPRPRRAPRSGSRAPLGDRVVDRRGRRDDVARARRARGRAPDACRCRSCWRRRRWRDAVRADHDGVDEPARDISCPAAPSAISVCGMPSCASSHAVRRAPCSSGRVSSTQTAAPGRAACGRAHHAERRAVAARRERAGVAVGEHARARGEQLGAVRAHGQAARDLVVVDAARERRPARPRSSSGGPGGAAMTSSQRSSAQPRLIAVGREPASCARASASSRRRAGVSAAAELRATCAIPIAAAMPIAGAPRMASSRIAAHTSATVVQRRSTRSPGSRVWSSSTTASPSSRITSAGASTRAARSGAGDDQVPSSQLVR